MNVKQDLTEQHRARRDANGFQVERSFIVEDLDGPLSARLVNAIGAGKVPQYGDPHPTVSDIQVTSITAEPVAGAGSSAWVRVIYSRPSEDDLLEGGENQGSIELSSNLADETTYFDINGNLLTATWDGGLTGTITRYGEAEVQRPQMRVTISRREASVPKEAIEKYYGKLNLSEWSGFPAGTWLCAGIFARDRNGEFEVDYSFLYRPEGWRVQITVALTNEQIEEAPIDVESGNGFANYDVYERANFNELGISF